MFYVRRIALSLLVLSCTALSNVVTADVIVTSWNIEHLGTDGRGFGGGYGGGNIPRRTTAQLRDIAEFIDDTLESDVIALQEIGITSIEGGVSRSDELDVIVAELGPGWEYYLPPQKYDHSDKSMYVGYLWNGNRVRALAFAPMDVPDIEVGGKALYDRQPVLGAFEIIDSQGNSKNDFALVNVHLASGQSFEENHLVAMTILELRLNGHLKALGITESDRIVLGDMNDNPYRKTGSGKQMYSPAMYDHMAFKGYTNFVQDGMGATRMDANLQSTIDHVLVHKSAAKHIDETKAEIWRPAATAQYPGWRETYSDHFPISIKINIGADDDAD